ncbi:RNA:RNP complex 1 interacting phosphatase [Echinococcus multilocularis]|uniref:RNA:RNP complex 1 interacting phosphatase n=1 Tax=Echinococcus multilocularis TaxID=6211 RepID=A0A0S4MIX6_ECHMU|nr:RNA:RNP complex 1 interacting phosphatase [Echinococcus multilocularis]
MIQRFLEIVKDVDDESPGGVIAVHCTHGVNRTGYLICRYLVDALGWDPDEAIEEFARARGHPIERENYIEDLRNRQH